jgi:hypothetical protein
MALSVVIDWDARRLRIHDPPHPVLPICFRWLARILSSPLNLIQGELMAITLTTVQAVALTIQPLDAKGNPAALDGPAVWTSSDSTIIDVVAAEDGLTAVATANTVGHAQIQVVADARMGPDVFELTGVLEIDVVAAEAVTLNIAAGEPYIV